MNIIKSIGKLGLDLEGEEFISRGRSGIEAGLRAIVDPLPNETINPEQKIKPSTPPTPSKDRDDVQIAKNLTRQAPATPIFDEFARATKGPLVIRAMRQAIVLPTNRPRYGVAEDLQSLLHCTRNVEDIIKIQPTLSQQLRPDAYVARFRLLVQMEEYEEMINRNPIIRNITLAENLDGFGAMDIVVHCDARKFRNGQNFLFKAVHSPRRIYEGKVINASKKDNFYNCLTRLRFVLITRIRAFPALSRCDRFTKFFLPIITLMNLFLFRKGQGMRHFPIESAKTRKPSARSFRKIRHDQRL